MSKRPRRSLRHNLRALKLNPSTGYYEAEEAGIVYHLTFEQYNVMKEYYFGSHGFAASFAEWYESLDRFEKKKIKRSGNLPKATDDFFPDPSYEE